MILMYIDDKITNENKRHDDDGTDSILCFKTVLSFIS